MGVLQLQQGGLDVGVEAKRGIVDIRGEAISTVQVHGQRGRGLTEVGGIMPCMEAQKIGEDP